MRPVLLRILVPFLLGSASAVSLNFESPGNLHTYGGVCVTAGSPDTTLDTAAVERGVVRELHALQIRALRMGEGWCTPARLRTGTANDSLVLSVEVAPLGRDSGSLAVIRANDPHLAVTRRGRRDLYDAVLWMHAQHLRNSPEVAATWRPALRKFVQAWALSRLPR